jgi:hypothetical protein
LQLLLQLSHGHTSANPTKILAKFCSYSSTHGKIETKVLVTFRCMHLYIASSCATMHVMVWAVNEIRTIIVCSMLQGLAFRWLCPLLGRRLISGWWQERGFLFACYQRGRLSAVEQGWLFSCPALFFLCRLSVSLWFRGSGGWLVCVGVVFLFCVRVWVFVWLFSPSINAMIRSSPACSRKRNMKPSN